MKKVITIPVYDSLSQANAEIKKYDFSFAYKVEESLYYKGDSIDYPESEVVEVPFKEILIQLTGDEDSVGLTYLDGMFITFNSID
jgi:hypothetical protein